MTDLARDLALVVLDWVELHTTMPAPVAGERGRRSPVTSWGHPREWASDMKARITDTLRDFRDDLAEDLGDTRPTATDETCTIRAAWDYLECRTNTEALFDHPGRPDFHKTIRDIHQQIQNALGTTRRHEWLPTPCPGCNLRTLFRADTGQIDCGTCGTEMKDEHYPIYTRRALDAVLESADCGISCGT